MSEPFVDPAVPEPRRFWTRSCSHRAWRPPHLDGVHSDSRWPTLGRRHMPQPRPTLPADSSRCRCAAHRPAVLDRHRHHHQRTQQKRMVQCPSRETGAARGGRWGSAAAATGQRRLRVRLAPFLAPRRNFIGRGEMGRWLEHRGQFMSDYAKHPGQVGSPWHLSL